MSKALTLSGLMALLLPKERLFVIHHLGADISEAVAGGTVEELESLQAIYIEAVFLHSVLRGRGRLFVILLVTSS